MIAMRNAPTNKPRHSMPGDLVILPQGFGVIEGPLLAALPELTVVVGTPAFRGAPEGGGKPHVRCCGGEVRHMAAAALQDTSRCKKTAFWRFRGEGTEIFYLEVPVWEKRTKASTSREI